MTPFSGHNTPAAPRPAPPDPYFNRHWKNHVRSPLPSSKIEEALRFLSPLISAIRQEPATIRRVLDVGCGDGVHAAALATLADRSFEFEGVDRSADAVATARSRMTERDPRGRFRFSVGDAAKLPFPDRSFDAVFSYGVLYYLEKPREAFDEMARVLKPGGLLGLWVYPDSGSFGQFLFRTARAFCRIAGPSGSRALVRSLTPFMRFMPLRSGVHPGNASRAQCEEVLAVNLLPSTFHFLKEAEALDWCRAARLSVESVNREEPVTVWARSSA